MREEKLPVAVFSKKGASESEAKTGGGADSIPLSPPKNPYTISVRIFYLLLIQSSLFLKIFEYGFFGKY